ncbi:helix-turn-helix domain-containing protein, partial [Celeribacter halophilus]
MSHRASHWLADIPADHMTHGAFRVLFHLCDAHNSQRPPETACFPSQAFLMDATGLSNSGLNKILNDLERDGLLVRRRTRNADGTRGPTYYILGCDLEEAQPTPLSGDGSKGEQTDADNGNGVVEKPVHKPVDKSPSNSTRAHKPTPL